MDGENSRMPAFTPKTSWRSFGRTSIQSTGMKESVFYMAMLHALEGVAPTAYFAVRRKRSADCR